MVKLLLAFLSCLLLLLLIAADGAIASICPPVDAYAPCDCMDYNPGIYLLCFNRNLTDSKVSAILDAFLTTPGVSPVDYLDLSGNLLTRVPNQIKSFTHLGVVHLKKNAITSIESGDFDFQSTVNPLQSLILENNQITTIAPGAFKSVGDPYGNDTSFFLGLTRNNLTRFEATVFRPLIEKLRGWPYDMVFIDSNPINCDDCHLAWLVRDNRHLLSAVGGQCTNGTLFDYLDPNAFTDCPSFVCPLGYDGYYADPLTCSKFYICNDQIAYPYDCPPSLVFNPENGFCDDVANVPSCQQK